MAKDIRFKATSRNNLVERYLLTFSSLEDYDEAVRLFKKNRFCRFHVDGLPPLIGTPVRVSPDDRAMEVDAAHDLGLSL